MVFGEGQQRSNKNTEKCGRMYERGKNRRIKGNPNVSNRENGRIKGKKHGTSDSGRRGRRFKSCRIEWLKTSGILDFAGIPVFFCLQICLVF